MLKTSVAMHHILRSRVGQISAAKGRAATYWRDRSSPIRATAPDMDDPGSEGGASTGMVSPFRLVAACAFALLIAAAPAGDAPSPAWATRLLAGYPGLVGAVTAREVVLSDGTHFPIQPSLLPADRKDDQPA